MMGKPVIFLLITFWGRSYVVTWEYPLTTYKNITENCEPNMNTIHISTK